MRNRIKTISPVARCALAMVAAFALAVPQAAGQQAASTTPLEYIESSSPLPGGGVVTSVYWPGQPQQRILPQPPPRTASGQSVLVRETSAATPAISPATVPPAGSVTLPPGTTVGVPRVPTLGVPTTWNPRPHGVYAPANLTGLGQPALTSLPTVTARAPAGPWTAPRPPLATNGSVQLQNMSPNYYTGRGITGSPRVYADGQPVRNLFRFLFP